MASVTHRFLFSVASLLVVWFGLFSYHFVDGWTAIKVPNLYDNHLCFVRFHFSYLFLHCFFLRVSRLVEGFYQINPLGLATFIFQFVFSRLKLLPHCNAKVFRSKHHVFDKYVLTRWNGAKKKQYMKRNFKFANKNFLITMWNCK